MVKYDNVNEALTNHFSIVWTDKAKKDIIKLFGQETYSFTMEIVAEGGNHFIIAHEDQELAHENTILYLKEKYPFLTNSSLIKIADAGAFFWKSDD